MATEPGDLEMENGIGSVGPEMGNGNGSVVPEMENGVEELENGDDVVVVVEYDRHSHAPDHPTRNHLQGSVLFWLQLWGLLVWGSSSGGGSSSG